jgi:hypothetical protein
MTALDLETWLHSLDRPCASRILAAHGYPVADKLSEGDVKDALRDLALNGSVDLTGVVSLVA